MHNLFIIMHNLFSWKKIGMSLYLHLIITGNLGIAVMFTLWVLYRAFLACNSCSQAVLGCLWNALDVETWLIWQISECIKGFGIWMQHHLFNKMPWRQGQAVNACWVAQRRVPRFIYWDRIPKIGTQPLVLLWTSFSSGLSTENPWLLNSVMLEIHVCRWTRVYPCFCNRKYGNLSQKKKRLIPDHQRWEKLKEN